ncbi:DJ-1/PfpI family protein [Streptomyces yaanensis]|uniref:DJ-1/PfpI family protein n=1 Tax=Streptomyces yaanensis TaxID=1142239 RepID=A0ABV7SMN5_9ACTN|nr:DJ-1/PfpI family protein [Streptomyces sp. CGMCC 4.7035]WNC00440.1 DJ-1/PfpI family protein [Streptomyces sp. CGMCC 4.7035]
MTGSSAPQHETPVKTIAFVQYPGLTPLDIVGPLQVFSVLSRHAPGYDTVVVGEQIEPMATDTPLSLVPSHTFETMPDPYALIVPGGTNPTVAAMADEKLLEKLRTTAARSKIVGSVCTGSLLLAAAGLLEGRRANTHWMYRSLLAKFGAIPVNERWVKDGNVVTAAGVSAGIDMALHLVGELAGPDTARKVQLFIEYDPEPPFGPIDWEAADPGQYTPRLQKSLHQALADHPALLKRLTS